MHKPLTQFWMTPDNVHPQKPYQVGLFVWAGEYAQLILKGYGPRNAYVKALDTAGRVIGNSEPEQRQLADLVDCLHGFFMPVNVHLSGEWLALTIAWQPDDYYPEVRKC